MYPYQKRWINDRSRRKIAKKSRRIGYSFGEGFAKVFRCLEREHHTCIVLSRGERQAKQFIEESVAPHVKALGIIAQFIQAEVPETSILKQEVKIGSSRIIALPANPDTARSYEGDVTLDEFAFHKDARKIYESIAPSITRGFDISIISTPNGQQGAYYDIAGEAGLVDMKAKSARWSAHETNLMQAITQGCLDKSGHVLDPADIRADCFDEDMWLQEYMCAFLSTAQQWISPELFESCVDAAAHYGYPDGDWDRKLFAGWDVARSKDLSVIWISELIGDVSWTRGVVELSRLPLPDQKREARALMKICWRMAIDQTGMGLALAEDLGQEFFGRIDGVTFTQQTKEALAVHGKARMQEGKVRIPDNDSLRYAFRSVKKSITATGLTRFDAEHDEQHGHADHFWAFCLAEQAASQPTHGLFELWKQQAQGMSQGGEIEKARTPEEKAKVQSDAQMAQALATDDTIARSFGAVVNKVSFSGGVQKPQVVQQTPKCPQCGSPNISRYRAPGMSQDWIEECACGWTHRTAK